MKELTIEENAKAYTELINRLEDVKDAIKKQNYGIAMDVLCKPYPQFQVITHSELKESEDERIKNEIIQFLQLPHPQFVGKRNYEEWISWLKKQGKQKPMDKIQLGKKYKCIASPRYSTFVKGLIYKPEDEFLCSLMNFSSDCFEPMEDNDQKPTDTVEPKFKVGDWIVNNEHNNVAKVLEVNEQYRLDYCDTIGTVSVDLIDNDYHLWTIQDAKDGDVLSYRDGQWIFIYKEKIDDNSFCYHTLYSTIHQDLTINDAGFTLLGDAIIPATKEQRDLLFQKMKEAGYDWDAEKKELKKIEQSPIDVRTTGYWHVEDVEQKSIWSEEDETKLKSACALIRNTSLNGNEGIVDSTITFLNSLKDRVQPQPKQEWSEEDRTNLFECIKAIKGNYSTAYGQELTNWLKSLENRVLLQTNEWSEEDEKILKAIHSSVDVKCLSKNELDYVVMVNWLKSLKDRVQSKQEWSDEDETNASYICAALDCYLRLREERNNTNGQEDLDKARNWLYNRLKSLKPQPQWKPSDEQIEALVSAIDIMIDNRGAGDKKTILLSGLYHELKAL